jgi:hypothetical protein
MDPVSLIPTPDSIPVPWGWFQLLLSLTFYLHVVVMNIMLGTALIAFFYSMKKKRPGDADIGRDISNQLPFIIAFAINFGVAPLLFAQVLYGHFLYTSSILMAVFWLSVIPVLIIAYYLTYIFKLRFDRLGRARPAVIGAAALLLLLIGFVFSNNLTLMQRPEGWHRFLTQPDGWLLNLADPILIPRYLHFVFAALAVGGMSIAFYYDFRFRQGKPKATDGIDFGLRWFNYATLANLGVGIWFFMTLPAPVRDLATPAGTRLGIVLAAGIVAGILAIIWGFRSQVRACLYATLAGILMMVIARDLVRASYLRPYFSPADLVVTGQYSPLIIFLVFLISGLFLIGWMVKLAFSAGRVKS